MEVSVHLHAPADLPTGESAPRIRRTGGWIGSKATREDVEKKQDRKCTYNLTLERVLVTTVSIKTLQ